MGNVIDVTPNHVEAAAPSKPGKTSAAVEILQAEILSLSRAGVKTVPGVHYQCLL